MKTTFNSLLIVLVITLFVFSCENKSENTNPSSVTGKLLSNSACKSGKSAYLKTSTPDSITCVNYVFDASKNKLSIKHINAGFNCCYDSLYCDISLNNDTIIIQEFEKSALCKCECLFDLDIEINGMMAKKYQVKFIEPNSGNQNKLFFELDLSKDVESSYCVTRKQYPWGNGF